MPGIYELLDGRMSISRIRQVKIEDLLRREPVKADTEKVRLSGYQVGRDIDIAIMVACTNGYHYRTSAGGEITE